MVNAPKILIPANIDGNAAKIVLFSNVKMAISIGIPQLILYS